MADGSRSRSGMTAWCAKIMRFATHALEIQRLVVHGPPVRPSHGHCLLCAPSWNTDCECRAAYLASPTSAAISWPLRRRDSDECPRPVRLRRLERAEHEVTQPPLSCRCEAFMAEYSLAQLSGPADSAPAVRERKVVEHQ